MTSWDISRSQHLTCDVKGDSHCRWLVINSQWRQRLSLLIANGDVNFEQKWEYFINSCYRSKKSKSWMKKPDQQWWRLTNCRKPRASWFIPMPRPSLENSTVPLQVCRCFWITELRTIKKELLKVITFYLTQIAKTQIQWGLENTACSVFRWSNVFGLRSRA